MSGYPNTLKYFMWPWQVFFRISCQTTAESLFNSLDKNLQPNVFIIGFNVNPNSNSEKMCIEPENLEHLLGEFNNINSIANEIRNSDEDRNMLYSGPGMQEEMDIRFQARTFREALEKLLNDSKFNENNIHFAASAVRYKDYDIFVVLALNKMWYNSHQHLQKKVVDGRMRIYRSFLETSVQEYISEKERNLYLPNPGKNLSGDSRSSDELLRQGANLFMYSVSCKGENFYGLHGLFSNCNELSQYRYENSENYGHLIIAKKNHPDIEMTLEVENPFRINEFRKTRKMLELSNEDVAVICDSYLILGLGKIKPSYEPSTESIFNVYFKGIHCWDVFHAGVNVLQMRYGIPQFSNETIQKEKFFLDAKRLFFGISNDQLENLFKLALASAKQKKGAMLIITDNAEEEAKRFDKRCISIKPVILDEKLLLNLTSIDGGVLIDTKGLAYAKGVILDGIAGHKGDSGRGSRYNSAITYCEHRENSQSTMIIVVSSDGMIDVVPALIPQIKHSEILTYIQVLEDLSSNERFDRGGFYDTMELLINRGFYLTKEECEKINNLKAQLQVLDEQSNNSLRRIFDDLAPSNEMNDAYYLNE